MANTYSQLYVQMIFAVKYRQSLVTPDIKSRIEQYICGIAENNHCKPIAVYCNPDHVHLLIGMKPKTSCSEVMRKIKAGTSFLINQNHLLPHHFEWQTGFGAFSYGRSQINAVCQYIQNQQIHHEKVSFKHEYITMLNAFDVEHDEQYIFDFLL